MSMIRTLLIDNYDSFTYNLYHLLAEINGREPTVLTNDHPWDDGYSDLFDNIVISPGPGSPDRARDFGMSLDALERTPLPILGVCLGHQGLALAHGGRVVRAPEPVHGRVAEIFHTGAGLLAGVPSPFRAVRYHSLLVADLPPELETVAWTADGLPMAIRHRDRPRWGFQFHPESISTEHGVRMLTNFRDQTTRRPLAVRRAREIEGSGGRPGQRTAGPSAVRSTYTLHHRRIPHEVDTEAAYRLLFRGGGAGFWLDSSDATAKHGRVSILGSAGGPLSERVSYEVASHSVLVTGPQGEERRVPGSIFDYLEARLAERSVEHPADYPLEFALGFVGYLGYELKAETGGRLVHRSEVPDAQFVFADRAIVVDHSGRCTYLLALSDQGGTSRADDWFDHVEYRLGPVGRPGRAEAAENGSPDVHTGCRELSIRDGREDYLKLIDACLELIASGESYEICLTNMVTSTGPADSFETYRRLRGISPAQYGSLLELGDSSVLSASPELFLHVDPNGVVESRPIKGTRRRGTTPDEDERLRSSLESSEKDRAENLMIVDLVRNDLGRVCELGTVSVPALYGVETYAQVHHMVSTVRGVLRDGVSAVDCVRAAFPPGSMTGAPKVRTMEILDVLESQARGVYSGSIGYFSLNGACTLSVAIRTMTVADGIGRFGSGGAIVALSDPESEFDEMVVKATAVLQALGLTQAHLRKAAD